MFGNLEKLRCLGIMNGTSLDGADFVLIEVTKKNFGCRYIGMQSFSFPPSLRRRLTAAVQHTLNVEELALLHHELGKYYASCFKKLKPELKDADVIGLHGQTVFHRGKIATLQIGEASYLSAVSGRTVVADFRTGDLALGGQGAPIATFFHQAVFGSISQQVAVHNLGGISNISFLSDGKLKLGFDTGPANMLVDMAVKVASRGKKHFDKDGKMASGGKADQKLVKKMLSHRFFKMKPPKSCGREEFGEKFYNQFKKELHKLSLPDRLRTLTEFVAESISRSYVKFCPDMPQVIVFCGGGANNIFLLSEIQRRLPSVNVVTTADHGWPVQSIEGAAFASLAAAKIYSIDSNLPQSTGAGRLTSLGKIVKV